MTFKLMTLMIWVAVAALVIRVNQIFESEVVANIWFWSLTIIWMIVLFRMPGESEESSSPREP